VRSGLRSIRLPSWGDLRTALWIWPAVASVISFLVGLFAAGLSPEVDQRLSLWSWPGDHDGARAFLQVVAGSVITITSLTFSLVVVALQLASQQFSPRLLREFARDRITQWVLGILVGTFVLSLTVLRQVDELAELPRLALALTFIMALISVASLLGFLGHIARMIRVDTILTAVHSETVDAINRHHELREETKPEHESFLQEALSEDRALVSSERSGFVQEVDIAKLMKGACSLDIAIVMLVRSGDHVMVGTPLAMVIGPQSRTADVEKFMPGSVVLGFERNLQHDPGLGLQQLSDIAVKALSTSINDPTTAGHAVGHLGDLLVRLFSRRLGRVVHCDVTGAPRVVTLDRDLRFYLDVAVAQIRRFGAQHPTVLIALLRMLRDLATVATEEAQRTEIERQIGLILATAAIETSTIDEQEIEEAARRARLALSGDIREAYLDRAGESRSG
jgi:uncharacterized membrane protein